MNKEFLIAQYKVESILEEVNQGSSEAIILCKYADLFFVRYQSDISFFLEDYDHLKNLKEILDFIKSLLILKKVDKKIEDNFDKNVKDVDDILKEYDPSYIPIHDDDDDILKAYDPNSIPIYNDNDNGGHNTDSKIVHHAVLTTTQTMDQSQYSKYSVEKTGHGFAAEDANALNDILQGKSVEKTGLSNEKNGPDRIVDGVQIQTKYYKTSQETLNSFFDGDKIKYKGNLEVPKDQFEAIKAKIRDKATRGEVFDSKGKKLSPKQAEKLIKQGNVTYKQARNIAKAGNLDSLTYDLKNQCVISVYTFGITYAVEFGRNVWQGKPYKTALKDGFPIAVKTTVTGVAVGVVSNQIIRTSAGKAFRTTIKSGLKAISQTKSGESFILFIAQKGGKSLNSSITSLSNTLQNDAIVASVSLAVMTGPDAYKAAVSGDISWKQFSKNLINRTMGVGAGVAAGMMVKSSAMATGAAIGSIFPGIGTAVGIGAGFVISSTAIATSVYAVNTASQAITDSLIEDDAVTMKKILDKCMEEVAYDYLLTPEECTKYNDLIQKMINPQWLVQMYKSGSTEDVQEKFAKKRLRKICLYLVSKRAPVILPSGAQVKRSIRINLAITNALNITALILVSYLTVTIDPATRKRTSLRNLKKISCFFRFFRKNKKYSYNRR